MGRIPPPITGMSLVTKEVLHALQSVGPVQFVNWSVGATKWSARTRLRYLLRYLNCAFQIWVGGKAHGRRLYLTANSAAGLYLTDLLVYAATHRGYSVYLHHHVYSYIADFDSRMARIDRWMSAAGGVHVVFDRKMADQFRAQYRSRCAFAVVLPSAVSIPVASPRRFPDRPLRLGMLSNLLMSKGLGRSIETFVALAEAGRKVELALAGPLLESEARQLIDRTVRQYGSRVRYLGPQYGDDKAKFLHDLDVFLFPTKYAHESWGIVLNEALAVGVPAITIDRGCTSVVVGDRAGLVVPDWADFVAAAQAQIERWLDHPEEYEAASRAAIEQADYLNAAGQSTLKEFAVHMFSPLGSTDGLIAPQ